METDGQATILVAEDNLVNQKVISLLLSQLGLKYDLVNNGREAVEAVRKKAYAAILMDVMMPEMDGFEATVAIRKFETLTGRYTPIIAVTALAMAGDRQRCLAVGMDDYLAKPIDKGLLKVKLDHWLKTEFVYHRQKLTRKYLQGSALLTIEAEPINLVELEDFYGAEELELVIRLFISTTESLLQKLESAIDKRQSQEVGGLSHELKGSSAAVGAKSMAKQCLYLEQAAGQQDWREAEETYSQLLRSFQNVRDYLSEALKLNVARET